MNKFSLPKWLPPKESPTRVSVLTVLALAAAMLFIVLPGIGFWMAFHDGDWMGLGLVGVPYGPLLSYLAIRKGRKRV